MVVWKVILSVLFGYAVGSINPSYIIGRARGFDIRKKGSGNAGASNALITMGKAVGAFSMIFDIVKGAVVFLLAPLIFRDLPTAAVLAGTACILGHMFPFYMKFRGGKGLATLGGVILAVDWRLFLIMLGVAVVLAVVTDYICVVPITASVALPILYLLLGVDGTGWLIHGAGGKWGALILTAATVAILCRHVQNIRRIFNGQEMHFSFLWKKDKQAEIDRVTGNTDAAEAPAEQEENKV